MTVPLDDTGAPVPKELFRSGAAERMRLYRQRRRDGVRRVLIELRYFEIYDLISLGLLRYEMRNNIQAIEHALHKLLETVMRNASQTASSFDCDA
jgi:hypothetical protein